MSYEVIHPFADLQDKTKNFPDGRVYAVGEVFPATKRKIDEDRIKELLSDNNSIGKAVIKVKDDA